MVNLSNIMNQSVINQSIIINQSNGKSLEHNESIHDKYPEHNESISIKSINQY